MLLSRSQSWPIFYSKKSKTLPILPISIPIRIEPTISKSEWFENFLRPRVKVSQEKIDKLTLFLQLFREFYLNWLLEQSKDQTNKESQKWLQFLNPKIGPVYLTGSYAIGTMLPTSDIDLLFFAPPWVQHFTFVRHFFPYFEKRCATQMKNSFFRLKFFESRSQALVPLVRFTCDEFLFDCLFAQLTVQQISFLPLHSRFHLDFSFLVKCMYMPMVNTTSLFVLNSARALFHLLSLIPPSHRILWQTFTQCILYWAKKKNICSNVTGFPSSIAYCILTCLIILQFPSSSTVFDLVFHFFESLTKWNGRDPFVVVDPSSLPVRKNQSPSLYFPRHQKQKSTFQVPSIRPMNVFLPQLPNLYLPLINACRNVTFGTREVFRKQIYVAFVQLKQMKYEISRQEEFALTMNDFFSRRGFFTLYPHFIEVICEFPKPPENFETQNRFLQLICFVRYKLRTLFVELDPFVESAEIMKIVF